MRLVFMGTPDFALPSLKALHRAGHAVSAVVSQPDRPKGRGGRLTPPPARVLAHELGIPVLQPDKIKDPAFINSLSELQPEIITVVAFGRILPPSILDLPPRGCINLHASLLPRYRGAAPIQWAIINGEQETGVTTIRMDPGMDTGDMILQERLSIRPEDTAGSLSVRLAEQGAELLLKTLRGIESGELTPSPQDHSKATLAPLLEKEAGEIDWTQPADRILNEIRGLNPWPGAYTFSGKDRWQVWKARKQDQATDLKPGTLIKVEPDGILVSTGQHCLKILEIQPSNGRRMSVREFLAGHVLEPRSVLGK